MLRARVFQVTSLLLAVSLFATVAVAQQAQVTPQGWVTQGPVMTPAPVSPPLITTPTMTFVTVSPDPVGATAAAGGNVAGATASALAQPVAAGTAVRTQAVFSHAPAAVPTAVLAAPPVENGIAPNGEPAPFNAGIGRFEGAGVATVDDGRSLGEIAAQLAPHRRPQPGRVYTDQDVERLDEYVAVRDQRFRPEQLDMQPDALAAPPLVPEDEELEREETRMDIMLQPEEPAEPEQAEHPETPPDPFMARVQPQEQEPFAPAEPDAAAQPETLPTTASPLPLMALLAVLAGAAGVVYFRLRG